MEMKNFAVRVYIEVKGENFWVSLSRTAASLSDAKDVLSEFLSILNVDDVHIIKIEML